MNRRLLISLLFVGVSMLVPSVSTAQSTTTAWGDPDLQGVWDFRTITPLERPEELADKEVLTAEEAALYEQETLAARNKDRRAEDGISAARDVSNAYNQFWWDYGDRLTEDRRTSLVVDPPDGRIPRKQGAGELARLFGNRIPAGPEDRPLWERCIIGFNSGPPMLPSAYNNNVQLFQTADYVVILNEMVHSARIVPLDRRPHLAPDIRQQVGDSRGHWDGETLVVESTNFLRETGFTGSGANLHLVERFRRVDENTLVYEFTVNEPEKFSQPWTAMIPMQRNAEPMFEYACHEGNYGMTNLLSGARAEERAAVSSAEGSR
jgi:hypothetical protein